MNFSEIHGASRQRLRPDRRLEKPDLFDVGLEARYRVSMPGSMADVFLSEPYSIGDGRVAAIAYVQEKRDGPVVARSVYRSNSQGLWRMMSTCTIRTNPVDSSQNRIVWYGKGHGQDSVNAPFAVQRALSEILESDRSTIQHPNDPEFILAGLVRDHYGENDTLRAVVRHTGEKLLAPANVEDGHERLRAPQKVVLRSGAVMPDFSRPVQSWKSTNALLGPVENEVYESADGTVRYLFSRSDTDVVWIAGVEKPGKLTSAGVFSEWYEPGELTTPPYEYASDANGYGDLSDRKGTRNEYVSMRAYLDRMPIIKAYRDSQSTSSR